MAEEQINHQSNLDFIDELRFLNAAILEACEKYDEMKSKIPDNLSLDDEDTLKAKATSEAIQYIYDHGFKENPSEDLLYLKKNIEESLQRCNAFIDDPDKFLDDPDEYRYFMDLSPYHTSGITVDPTATRFRCKHKVALINKEMGIVQCFEGDRAGDAWFYHKNGEKKRCCTSMRWVEALYVGKIDGKEYYTNGGISFSGEGKERSKEFYQSGRVMSTRELDGSTYVDTTYFDNKRHAISSVKRNGQEIYAEYKSGNVKFKKEGDQEFSYWDNEQHSIKSIEKNGRVIYAEYENGQPSMKQEEIDGKTATKYYSEKGLLTGIKYGNGFVAFNQPQGKNTDALALYKQVTQNIPTSYMSEFARITRGHMVGANTCDMENGQKALGIIFENTYWHKNNVFLGGGTEVSWCVATAIIDTKRNAIFESEPSAPLKIRDRYDSSRDFKGEIDKQHFLSIEGGTAYAKIVDGCSSSCSFDEVLYQKILQIAINDENNALSPKIKKSIEKIEQSVKGKQSLTKTDNVDSNSSASSRSNGGGGRDDR